MCTRCACPNLHRQPASTPNFATAETSQVYSIQYSSSSSEHVHCRVTPNTRGCRYWQRQHQRLLRSVAAEQSFVECSDLVHAAPVCKRQQQTNNARGYCAVGSVAPPPPPSLRSTEWGSCAGTRSRRHQRQGPAVPTGGASTLPRLHEVHKASGWRATACIPAALQQRNALALNVARQGGAGTLNWLRMQRYCSGNCTCSPAARQTSALLPCDAYTFYCQSHDVCFTLCCVRLLCHTQAPTGFRVIGCTAAWEVLRRAVRCGTYCCVRVHCGIMRWCWSAVLQLAEHVGNFKLGELDLRCSHPPGRAGHSSSNACALASNTLCAVSWRRNIS